MMEIRITRTPPDELRHHGVKGQRWGQRRFQNQDGSLTVDGQRHREAMTSGSTQAHYEQRRMARQAIRQQRLMRGRDVAESHKNDSIKSTKTEKLMDVGFKALSAYLTIDNFKDDWA